MFFWMGGVLGFSLLQKWFRTALMAQSLLFATLVRKSIILFTRLRARD